MGGVISVSVQREQRPPCLLQTASVSEYTHRRLESLSITVPLHTLTRARVYTRSQFALRLAYDLIREQCETPPWMRTLGCTAATDHTVHQAACCEKKHARSTTPAHTHDGTESALRCAVVLTHARTRNDGGTAVTCVAKCRLTQRRVCLERGRRRARARACPAPCMSWRGSPRHQHSSRLDESGLELARCPFGHGRDRGT